MRTPRRRGHSAGPQRAALTFEVAGLERRALEALRLELLRLGEARGFRVAEFRIVETDRSR